MTISSHINNFFGEGSPTEISLKRELSKVWYDRMFEVAAEAESYGPTAYNHIYITDVEHTDRLQLNKRVYGYVVRHNDRFYFRIRSGNNDGTVLEAWGWEYADV